MNISKLFRCAGAALAISFASILCADAVNVRIIYLTNDELKYDVSQLSKLDFSDGTNMKTIATDGTQLHSDAISSLRVITFDDATGVTPLTESSEVKVYPNPAQDVLYVNGIEKGTMVTVIDYSGKVRFEQKAADDKVEISVSNFNDGNYLLKIGNKAVKFIKK